MYLHKFYLLNFWQIFFVYYLVVTQQQYSIFNWKIKCLTVSERHFIFEGELTTFEITINMYSYYLLQEHSKKIFLNELLG